MMNNGGHRGYPETLDNHSQHTPFQTPATHVAKIQVSSYKGIHVAKIQVSSYKGIQVAKIQVSSCKGIHVERIQVSSYKGIYVARIQVSSYKGIHVEGIQVSSYKGIHVARIQVSSCKGIHVARIQVSSCKGIHVERIQVSSNKGIHVERIQVSSCDGIHVAKIQVSSCDGIHVARIQTSVSEDENNAYSDIITHAPVSYCVRVLKRESFANITVNELVLRKNPVKHIHNDVFQDLKDSLEVLDMDSSRIKIDTGLPFLQGLTNLKVLDLGYNQLKNKYKTFPSGIFAGLDLLSLRTLTLQALQMSNIDSGAFTGIEHLEQLDLSFNFLYEFPTELLSLKNLKDLKLYSNDIEFLRNNTFKGLQNLRQLLIGVNEIDTIEDGAFNDLENSIKELNFYHNPLYKVPSDAINGLKSLTKLSLVKTNLETVPNGTFDGEYQLTELHLDHNPGLQFSDEGMFYGIEDSLETLFIRTLNLTQLPLNVLQRLSKLKYLDASNNAIKQIDKDFFKGLQLQSIQLSWNKIRNIDHLAFTAFEKGVVINLHNNNLRDLSFILELDECTFDEVHVTGNSIKCDCGVEKVINSGLVTWGLTGECYVEEDKVKQLLI
ncbi:LIGO4-like protein [Mya arenaria]|uniref:LIGO4-like protein n=1 Tax=Mya arenaria TaxID=6604 RepID=A0ABY7DJA4_MYAAR|nr:LIGO4-like protein [Mya arenaria]